MIGLFGRIRIRRAQFQCTRTGRMFLPLEEQLDLPRGEVSPALAQRVLHMATHMSLAEVQTAARLYLNIGLCDSVLDRLLHRAGTVAAEDARGRTEALMSLPPGEAREQQVGDRRFPTVPKRLYISTDGALYPSRIRQALTPEKNRILYQEMKCGAIFWQSPDGAWQKVVEAGREEVLAFGMKLWRTAVTCGLLEAEEVIFISDGGAWCQTVYDTYFRGARRILDWYHLSEHVWEAARQLYPTDSAAVARWAHTALDQLEKSSGIGLHRFLEEGLSRCVAESPPAVALTGLSNYLTPRLAHTDYVEYRAGGYVIGSGMMESTCKQIVAARLKGSGRQWSEKGAVAMAHLLTHRLNGTWEQFWTGRPLQRAA